MRNYFLTTMVLILLSFFPVKEFGTFIYYENKPLTDCGVLVDKFTDYGSKGKTKYNFVIDFEKRGRKHIQPTSTDYRVLNVNDNLCYDYNPIREKAIDGISLTFLGLLGFFITLLLTLVVLPFLTIILIDKFKN